MILIVAGDPSGDLHGSHLIARLKERGETVAAVGGPLMRAAALGAKDEFLCDLASLGVTGFIEPIRQLGRFRALLAKLSAFIDEKKPSAVVCIDYYGFNRWVLASAKARGRKTFYYISPQVWASRRWRINKLRAIADKMLVIFPFEEKLYREAGVPVEFVGHPLVDLLPAPRMQTPGSPLQLGLLPGSRASEVSRHLPVFLDACAIIRRDFPRLDVSVFAGGHLPDSSYAAATAAGCKLVRERGYGARAGLDLALSSSGTATLENALLSVPMVVVYKMNWPTYLIARSLIQVPYISMANLLAGEKLVPELIQHEATGEKIAEAALGLLQSPAKLLALKEKLAELRRQLGNGGASLKAAQIILRESGIREEAAVR